MVNPKCHLDEGFPLRQAKLCTTSYPNFIMRNVVFPIENATDNLADN
jgi:hypothetical protein